MKKLILSEAEQLGIANITTLLQSEMLTCSKEIAADLQFIIDNLDLIITIKLDGYEVPFAARVQYVMTGGETDTDELDIDLAIDQLEVLVREIHICAYRHKERAQLIALLKVKQWLVTSVSNTGAYTVGLSVLCGYELLVVLNGGIIAARHCGYLVNEIAMAMIAGTFEFTKDSEFTDNMAIHSSSNKPTRYRPEVISSDEAIELLAYGLNTYEDLIPKDYKVVKITLGDINNNLPGETTNVIPLIKQE